MTQEQVFKALADESRRKLLDLLYLENGQSLSQLGSQLPMTRFGVMKHLRILKGAGLITMRKRGRETLHYLNAVPIQMVYNRWVSKYSRGWARSLTELKYEIEETEAKKMTETRTSETTQQVFQIYIKTTPERLWQALTDGEMTKKYYYGTRAESDWKADSTYRYNGDGGDALVDGKVIESDPPRRLVTTFNPHWDAACADYPQSKVTFEVEPHGSICRLTLVHEGMAAGHPITEGIFRGWSEILSGLKTLLETGEPMAPPTDS